MKRLNGYCTERGGADDHPRRIGNLIKVSSWDFDHCLYLLSLMVDMDGELRGLVKATLQRLGRLVELEMELR